MLGPGAAEHAAGPAGSYVPNPVIEESALESRSGMAQEMNIGHETAGVVAVHLHERTRL
jgi:hypothetical protein